MTTHVEKEWQIGSIEITNNENTELRVIMFLEMVNRVL